MCACGTEVETTEHLFLHCQFYTTQRLKLENLGKVELNFPSFKGENQDFLLLYGYQTNNSESRNQEILKNLISYLEPTTRVGRPLIIF